MSRDHTPKEPHSIGQAIRISRAKKGLTLQQLGDKLGLSRASLSKIELSHSITFKKLKQVSYALGFKPSEVVKLTESVATPEDILRDIVECGYLTERAYTDRGEGDDSATVFEEICDFLGEDPSEYLDKTDPQES